MERPRTDDPQSTREGGHADGAGCEEARTHGGRSTAEGHAFRYFVPSRQTFRSPPQTMKSRARTGDARGGLSRDAVSPGSLRWLGVQRCAAALMLAAAPAAPAAPQLRGRRSRSASSAAVILAARSPELWVESGHEVLISSRHPEQLKTLAASLGPRAHVGTPREAALFGEVVRGVGSLHGTAAARCRTCAASSPARSCSTPAIPIRSAMARWPSRCVVREPG